MKNSDNTREVINTEIVNITDDSQDLSKQQKEDKQPAVNNPHDKGYKKSLSNPKEFLHFLKKYVGAGWMMELKESQLTAVDKEFITKDFEGKEADLIYCVTKENGEKVYIFILQELQSSVDHTMIFRVLMYVYNTLLRFFLNTEKNVREQSGFRLPVMVPIVFYNGEKAWTAVKSFREYQEGGELFGNHVLNLEYYLVNLSDIEEELILSTNTVIDNIMYCDKFRETQELIDALRAAYQRVDTLSAQEKEEFNDWVRKILLGICKNKEAVVEEILNWAEKGDGDMAFKYNIIKAFENERAEGRAIGKAESILELLEELEPVSEDIRDTILAQTDLDILKMWLKCAAQAESLEDWKTMIGWNEV